MIDLEPIIIENGTYRRTRVKTTAGWRDGITGDNVEKILDECEQKGFLAVPSKERHIKKYTSLRDSFLSRCREKNKIYIEVFIENKENRAFACFDTISLNYKKRIFPVSEMILETELNYYYESLTTTECSKLCLPADLNPYSQKQHRLHYFCLPKQICFAFYLDHTQIFEYLLNKVR